MTPPKAKRAVPGSAAGLLARTMADAIPDIHPRMKKQVVNDDTSKLHRNLNDLDTSIQELKNELQLLKVQLHDCMVDDDEEDDDDSKSTLPSGTSAYQRRILSQNSQVCELINMVKVLRGSLTV